MLTAPQPWPGLGGAWTEKTGIVCWGRQGNGLLRSLRAQLYWEPTPQSSTSLAVQLGSEPCPGGTRDNRASGAGEGTGGKTHSPQRGWGGDPGSEQEVSWDKSQRAAVRQN